MRGRKPIPTELKILAGSRGRRKAKSDTRPRRGAPNVPTNLSREAKAEWLRIVPELDQLGLLTVVDRAALTHYCEAHAEAVACSAAIRIGRFIEQDVFARESGLKTGTRQIINPAIKQRNEAWRIVRGFLAEFGLTPSSRTRLTGRGDGPKVEKDPLQELIERGERIKPAV